ncbi:MAG TPA: CHRD domain-containing protein [Acidimicrobiales bacterium]|nr:CHRD domain-containing protein [Acidimicrobiales bacterium]
MNKRFGVAVVAAAAGLIGAAVAFVPGIASGSGGSNGSDLNTAEFGAGTKQLVAGLSGMAEVPTPSVTTGSGIANVWINPATNQICWSLTIGELSGPAIAAHIHKGAVGVAGPIVVPLSPPNPSSSGCTTDATNAPLIAATPSDYYVNVHTAANPAGEARGQLAAAVQSSVLLPVPLRAYDSRLGDGKLQAGQTRTIGLASGKDASGANQIAVPVGATAALVNLTITDTEGAGFVKMYSAAISEPATSSINWSQSDQNLAVSTPVAVDSQGRIKLTGGVNSTNVVVDVIGYLI